MTAIDRYVVKKAQLAEAQAWANLAVLPNKGKYNVESLDCVIRDKTSSTPPARIPASLSPYVNDEAAKKTDNIVALAITAMQAELTSLAELARQEYAQIAADAGVTVP